MDTLTALGLLVGFTWGTAGLLGYPGLSWKPGTLLALGCLFWLATHDALPPEPLIEALAFFIFIGLSIAQKRWLREKPQDKPAPKPDA